MSTRIEAENPFAGPRLKVERANRHIADYRAAFKYFADSNTKIAASQSDQHTGIAILDFGPMPSVPDDMRCSGADALYNLRSALDQAMCCSAVSAGESPDGTYFPHGINQRGFEASLG